MCHENQGWNPYPPSRPVQFTLHWIFKPRKVYELQKVFRMFAFDTWNWCPHMTDLLQKTLSYKCSRYWASPNRSKFPLSNMKSVPIMYIFFFLLRLVANKQVVSKSLNIFRVRTHKNISTNVDPRTPVSECFSLPTPNRCSHWRPLAESWGISKTVCSPVRNSGRYCKKKIRSSGSRCKNLLSQLDISTGCFVVL